MKRALRLSLVLSAAVLTGCASGRSDTYLTAFGKAERAQTAGRYDEAATAYMSASEVANWPRDKEYARYLSGLMKLEARDLQGGIAILEPIARANTGYSAMAAYKLADLEITRGDPERGYKMLAEIPAAFPDHGMGRVALTRMVRHLHETSGAEGALGWIDSVKDRLGKSGAAETAWYERGKLLSELGRTKESRDSFVHVADVWKYPRGAFLDDALYAASFEDEKLGDPDAAIADLRRLLADREIAWLNGSAQRPKYAVSLYRIAVLYDQKKKDKKSARDALHELYAEHTTSPLRDDALFYEAKLWEQDGDHSRACDTLKTLVEKLADSKFVPCAEARCNLHRDGKSRSPKTCHQADPGTAPSQTGDGKDAPSSKESP
jgi:tetratricopeptide (TPR) repeat protein